MTERALRKKNRISKKAMLILLLSVVLVFSLLALSYAWYQNYVEFGGTNLTTGKISFEVNGFNVDSSHNVSAIDPIVIDGRTDNSVILESTVVKIDAWDSISHAYYIIKNPASDTSIDLDAALTISLDNQTIDERLGGITVDIVEVKNGKIAEDLEGLTTEQIANIIAQKSENGEIIPDGDNIAFTNLEKAYHEFFVAKGEYVCLRVTYEMPHNLSDYQNMDLNVRVSFCLAQENGLPGATNNEEYSVFSLEGLQSALSKYRPNDKIIIKGDIEYIGDLIFNRPVKLEVQNAKLDIVGNLRMTYPYQGRYSIDTTRGGSIAVFMNDVEQFDEDGNLIGVLKLGGDFDISAPLAQVEIMGKNSTSIDHADIYVEGDITIDASMPTAATNYGNGVIINGANIRPVLDERGDTEGFKEINLGAHTKISVLGYTEIGKIISAASVIEIENRGSIGGIDLSRLVIDGQYSSSYPQIHINNYGTLRDTNILLPYSWAVKFDGDATPPTGNTKIVSQPGSGFMTTNTTVGFKSDGSRDPDLDDIEYISLGTYIEKVGGNPDDLIIQYTADTGMYLVGTSTDIGSSLKTLMQYYMGDISVVKIPGTSDEATNVSSELEIADLKDIKSIKIKCYSTELTSEDYTYIKTMSGLVSIDLTEASSTGLKTPDNAFKGLTNLTKVTPSAIDTTWGNYLFQNTKVDEIRLPDSLLSVASANTFNNIKYIHTAYRYIDYVNVSKSYRLVFVPDDVTYAEYNVSAFYGYVFYDAQRYSFDTGDYFLHLDSENKTAEFIAYRPSGALAANTSFNAANELAGGAKFDFNSITVDGTVYDIKVYGPYSFYNKTISGITELNFSEKLNEIESYAFGSTKGMGNVTINGTPIIQPNAFRTATTTGLNITGEAEIKDNAFYDVTATTVEISTNKPIGAYSFYSANSIKTLNIKGKPDINEYAFYGATAADVEIATDKTIYSYAFANMVSSGTVNITGNPLITDYAFNGATIGNLNITTSQPIGEYAFASTKNIEVVNITGNPVIGSYAFKSSQARKINAPDVVEVGTETFASMGRFVYGYFPSLVRADEPFKSSGVIFMLHIGIFEEGCTMGLGSRTIDYIFIHTKESDSPENFSYAHTYTYVSGSTLTANNGTIFLPSVYAELYTNYGSEIGFNSEENPNQDRWDEIKEYYNPADPFYDNSVLMPNLLYYVNEDGTATIFRYLHSSPKTTTDIFAIPKEDGSGYYEVSEIYNYAYRNTSITRNEVVLPETVKTLKTGAFYGASTTATSTVNKKIGRLDLSNVEVVGNSAFYNCDISVIEGYQVHSAGTSSFANSEALLMIILPKLTTITAVSSDGWVTTFNNNTQLRVAYLGPLDDESIVKERFFQGSNNLEYLVIDLSEKEGTSNAKSTFHNSNGGNYNTYPITLIIGSSTWGFHNSVQTDESFSNIAVSGSTNRATSINTYMSIDIPQYMFRLEDDGTSTLLRCTSVEEGLERYEVPNRVAVNGDSYEFLGFSFNTCDILDADTEGGYKVDNLEKGAYRMVPFGDTVFNIGPYITSIPSWMFYQSSFRYVELENVVTINTRAFDNCDSLVDIKMDNVETLASMAFYDCDKYTSVSLPAIKTISTHVFAESSTLKSITLGENLTSIGSETFRNDTALVEIINLSNSYVSFPSTLFVNGNNNKTVVENIFLTVRNTHLSQYESAWGSKLGGISSFEGAFIEAETGLNYFYTTIDGTANVELSLLRVPESYVLGDSIVLPNTFSALNDEGVLTDYTVTRISGGLLSSIKNLNTVRNITLPNNVTELEGILGDIPSNLATLVLASSNTQYKTVDGVLYTKDGGYLLHYPKYKTDITFTVPSEVRVIVDDAFNGSTYLQHVIINSPVTVLSGAFKGASVLASVTFTSYTPSVLVGRDMFEGTATGFAIYVPEALVSAYKASVIVDTHIRDIITFVPAVTE